MKIRYVIRVGRFHLCRLKSRIRSMVRRCIPDLKELDAYRTLKKIDEKLKDFPTAIPLLEKALVACKETDQEEKWFDYARRLRDYDPPPRAEWLTAPCQNESEEESEAAKANARIKEKSITVYNEALRLVRSSNQASISYFQRHLGIGYNHAAKICERMEDCGIIGPASGLVGMRKILRMPTEDDFMRLR